MRQRLARKETRREGASAWQTSHRGRRSVRRRRRIKEKRTRQARRDFPLARRRTTPRKPGGYWERTLRRKATDESAARAQLQRRKERRRLTRYAILAGETRNRRHIEVTRAGRAGETA